MFQLTVLYNPPAVPAALDKHYDDVHDNLATKLPGLQRYTVTRPGPDMDGNAPAYHLVALPEWADAGAFQEAVASETARPHWPICRTPRAPG